MELSAFTEIANESPTIAFISAGSAFKEFAGGEIVSRIGLLRTPSALANKSVAPTEIAATTPSASTLAIDELLDEYWKRLGSLAESYLVREGQPALYAWARTVSRSPAVK